MHAKNTHLKTIAWIAAPLAASAVILASPVSATAHSLSNGGHHARPLAGPSNDNFGSPTFLPGPSGSLIGQDNIGATAEVGEPQHKPGNPAQASVWFRWTSPVTGHVLFRTKQSDFDTVMAAYTGSSLGTLFQVASNDDTPFEDGSALQSQIGFAALKGTTYNIAVDSFNSQSTGNIVLSWTTNDDFDAADVLEPGTLGSTLVANTDNNGATAQAGEPAHDGFSAGASIWFSWKAPATGLARFSTFANDYDTVLAAYTGPSVSSLKQIAQNDDANSGTSASEIVFSATRGKTYHIAVSGFGGVVGFTQIAYRVENPTLSVGDFAAGEGDSGSKLFSFPVTLAAKSDSTVKVSFTTSNGTATAGSDYQAKSGTLTFKPGQTRKTVNVTVFGDSQVEPLETFKVNLSNPVGGGVTIGDGQGIGSIIADD